MIRFALALVAAITVLTVTARVTAKENVVAAGKSVYSQTCIACHGANGKGSLPGVADLTAPDGPLAKSDDELIGNITNGFQSPGAVLAMPPKGGNPALDHEDIEAVVAYLRQAFGKAK